VDVGEVHPGAQVRAGAHRDDPGSLGGQVAVQAAGQREVAEVVGGELALPALAGAPERAGHDPGVVDQDVHGAAPGADERRDRGLVGQVERGDGDLPAGGRGDVGGGPVAGDLVADGDGDVGACAGQRTGGLDADAGRAAGDDGPPTAQVDVGQYLGRGGPGGERGADQGGVGHVFRPSRIKRSHLRYVRPNRRHIRFIPRTLDGIGWGQEVRR
jgi:hypothetical protein